MTSSGFNLYIAIRSVLRLALGFYFRRIERFHPERVPEQGPVLFTSNHPNSITDSFIIGISVAIAAGIVAFGGFYAAYIVVFHRFFAWPWGLWYGLSLAPASLLAHYYSRQIRHLAAGVRNALVLLEAPAAAKRLLHRRNNLIAEIEAVRAECPIADPAAGR